MPWDGDILMKEIFDGPKRLRAICRNAERAEIARALIEASHNRTRAAVSLGISRRTLLNKIKEYRMTRNSCRNFAVYPELPI